MKCPQCSAALEEGARFCGVCGGSITESKQIAIDSRAAHPTIRDSHPDIDPFVGMVLNNRFRVAGKLGEGGFGAVYQGIQLATERKVAIKVLHPEMTRDENVVARFRREGLVLCNLRDAHTITTYDFDQTPDGTLYIAMELLEGKSLHDVFRNEAPIDWRRTFKVLIQMCSSLAEAHSQGIVHRDLKPENIHLETRAGDPEFVKILDFGIAKVLQGDGSTKRNAPQLTATGQTLGTLEYMSPEQLMGKELDGRSDVYAMGVLAYELVTGRLPFPDAKGPAGLITAQLREIPDAPSSVHPDLVVPAGVDACILKMLEKDKNKRFADAQAMRETLQTVLDNDGIDMEETAFRLEGHRTPLQRKPSIPPQAAPPQAAPPQAAQAPVANPPLQSPPQPRPAAAGPSTRAALQATKASSPWLWVTLAAVVVGGGIAIALSL